MERDRECSTGTAKAAEPARIRIQSPEKLATSPSFFHGPAGGESGISQAWHPGAMWGGDKGGPGRRIGKSVICKTNPGVEGRGVEAQQIPSSAC